MSLGLIGKKVGMTRLFDESGVSTPVTVLQVEPNVVAQLKTVENDGYRAVQVTTGKLSAKKVNKPQAGHFAKANVEAGVCLKEFRLADDELPEAAVGSSYTVEHFAEGQLVDVQATSRGKGFAGCVKRHNFKTQDATHGNSLSHRAPGSIGMCQTPGRVFKGKKMAGQMGNKRVTTTGLRIAKIDVAKHLILVKGAVPGAPGAQVVVKPSVKKKGQGVKDAA